MLQTKSDEVLGKILQNIELPDGAYERAEERYKRIYEWLIRDGSACAGNDPHVYSSGSFRLGTAIRPYNKKERYDLDITCELREGISSQTHTQERLKELIGGELELYRKARGIQKRLEEKRRCWTLEYADDLGFHMDIVPCIPESTNQQARFLESMVVNSRLEKSLASDVANRAIAITDNKRPDYALLSNNWPPSNPEGFAKWFESRMRIAQHFLEAREVLAKAQIDDLPYFRWKTPLQQAIQLLKRHRDTMFANQPDSKPISVIITTLSARAYQGENTLSDALRRILSDMDSYINPAIPHVPNPVNPEEDFADKWYSLDHAQFRLKESFQRWLRQACLDFDVILSTQSPTRIVEAAAHGLDVQLNKRDLEQVLGIATVATPTRIIRADEPRPWFRKR